MRALRRGGGARQDRPRLLARRLARDARRRSGRAARGARGVRELRALARARRARLPRARRGRARTARRPAGAGARDRLRADVPDRHARRLGAAARGGRPRRRADRDLAGAARPSRRRAEAHRHDAARDRHPQLGRAAVRQRRLDGRASRTATCSPASPRPRSSSRSAASTRTRRSRSRSASSSSSRRSQREAGFGAVLLVARPESDPVPGLRARAEGIRLPGGS